MLEIGRIAKAHGLDGGVIVVLITDRTSRLDAGSVLNCERGELVVERSRPYQDRYLVHFEGVVDRTGSESMRGLVLFAEPLEEPDTLWVHELVGSEVVDQHGRHLGAVTAIEANPASDLMVLEGGIYIPLVFVRDHTPGHEISVEIPEGLVE